MSGRRHRPSIGIIADGHAELRSLHLIPWGFTAAGGVLHVRLPPNLQPKGPARKQARACAADIRELDARKGMWRIVVIVDREDRPELPAALAAELRSEILSIAKPARAELHVVVKDIAYENWLFADYTAFSKCPGRFSQLSESQRREEAQVDGRNVKSELERLCQKSSYDKVADAVRLAPHIDPERAAARSSSFSVFSGLLAG